MLAASVLRVGLLPQRMWTRADFEGVDFSALGAPEQQLTPQPVPYWENPNTDAMQLRRRRAAMRPAQHRPTLAAGGAPGAEVQVLDYVQVIVEGFRSTYRLLVEQREALLAGDGPLAQFDQDQVRIIVRPTQAYGMLLHESFHPDLLRNALDRERFFDRLWVGVEPTPFMTRLIPSERRDLWRGDIPMFVTRPGSRDVWDSSGQRLAGFLDRSGAALVRQRLLEMDEDDLTRQVWLIRGSLSTLGMGVGGSQLPTYRLAQPTRPASREALLSLARAAGDRLDALALARRGTPGSAWIGLTLLQDQHWSLAPLRLDFYDGLPGVAFFLAYLGQVTGEPRYTARAESALHTVRAALETDPGLVASIGAFEGWGGILYTLTHLGVLWDRPSLLAEADSILDHLAPRIAQDEHLDIINGAAGCLASLMALYRCRPSEQTLSLAIQCGERLLGCARPMPQGHGWVVPGASPAPLAGFSHGAAGISWALLNLSALSGQARFREAALNGWTPAWARMDSSPPGAMAHPGSGWRG
jgi:type 2 lantibiotic biosynthesis protein LanM